MSRQRWLLLAALVIGSGLWWAASSSALPPDLMSREFQTFQDCSGTPCVTATGSTITNIVALPMSLNDRWYQAFQDCSGIPCLTIAPSGGSSFVTGSGTTGQFATWTAPTSLGTFDLFGTANTFTAIQALSAGLTVANVNTISSPVEGLIAYDPTRHLLVVYNGTMWDTVMMMSVNNMSDNGVLSAIANTRTVTPKLVANPFGSPKFPVSLPWCNNLIRTQCRTN